MDFHNLLVFNKLKIINHDFPHNKSREKLLRLLLKGSKKQAISP